MSLNAPNTSVTPSPSAEHRDLESIMKRVVQPVVHGLQTFLPGSGLNQELALKNAREVVQWHLKNDRNESRTVNDNEWRIRVLRGVLGGFCTKGGSPTQSTPPGEFNYEVLKRSALTITYRSDTLLDFLIGMAMPPEAVASAHGLKYSRDVVSALSMAGSLIGARFDYGSLPGVSNDPSGGSAPMTPSAEVTLTHPDLGKDAKIRLSSRSFPPRLANHGRNLSSVWKAKSLLADIESMGPALGEEAIAAHQVLSASIDSFVDFSSQANAWKAWMRKVVSSTLPGFAIEVVQQLKLQSVDSPALAQVAESFVTYGSRSGFVEWHLAGSVPPSSSLGGKFQVHRDDLVERVQEAKAAHSAMVAKSSPESDGPNSEAFFKSLEAVARYFDDRISEISSSVEEARARLRAAVQSSLETAQRSLNEQKKTSSQPSPKSVQLSDAATAPTVTEGGPSAKAREAFRQRPDRRAPKAFSAQRLPARKAVPPAMILSKEEAALDEGTDGPEARQPSATLNTRVVRGELDQEDTILDALMNAKNAEWCVLELEDGRKMDGVVVFNEFRRTGRIINFHEEYSYDFREDQVAAVQY